MYLRIGARYKYVREITKFLYQARSVSIEDIQTYNYSFQQQFNQYQFNLKSNEAILKLEPQSNLQEGLYQYIKNEIISGDIPELNEAASHYFSKEGKLIRPLLNMLFYQHLDPSMSHKQQQIIWASVIEILHVASLIHDDILDDSPKRRGLDTSHILYGKKRATFSGNYLIGRAGRKIAEFEDIEMFQIYSQIMENLTNGEYLQALKFKNYQQFDQTMRNYMIKTYYKTAALIANSLKGVCQLSQFKQYQNYAFNIGLHLGVSFQLIDDVLDYTAKTAQLGKENLSDLKNGVVTGPVLYEYFNQYHLQSSEYRIMNLVLNGKSTDYNEVNRIVLQGTGIEQTKYLAYLHTQEALDLLAKIREPQQQLLALIFMLLSREK